MNKLTIAFFAGLLAFPSVALAGGCPTCTTSADCMPPGGGAGFCVEWSRDFGCGGQRIACCPGQACDTSSGRPSCEGADADDDGVIDCIIVGASDAGTPTIDAGPSGTDSGPSGTDSGPSGTDSGPSGADSGPSAADAGSGAADGGLDPATDGGCGCRVGGATTSPALLLGLIAMGMLFRSGRRKLR